MQQIAEGRVEHLPSEYLARTREDISTALEELIEVGARIRPLLAGGKRVGWVRGVHLFERKALKRWVADEIDFVMHLMRLGTSLSEEEIRDLNIVELRSLSRVVRTMTESDTRLYPYLHAFTTTSVSEQLWYSQGTALTAFRERFVDLPDGKRMRLSAASDQARLWATLCNYRIQTKVRLDASFNAVLMVRPWVGKGADPLSTDLKNMARDLQTDSFEPWKEVIRTKPEANLEDGWAHSEDDSIEGMRRELEGMARNDRHEQVIAAFEAQERERAERKRRDIEEKVMQRRADLDRPQGFTVLTEEEVLSRTAAAQQQRDKIKPVVEEESQSSLADRLAKYK